MSYIVHGGPLFWGPIAAAVVAVLAWRWLTHRHFRLGPLPRERYVPAHAPGGGVSPRAAAGSVVPGGGDAGDFPAGRAPRDWGESRLPCAAERTAELAAISEPWDPLPQPAFIHHCPPDGEHLTPCCRLNVLDLEYGARVSPREEDVTCPAARLEPLPLPDYLPAPAAVHYAPDVPQAAECGPDHAYDDLYRDTFQPHPKGDYLLSVVQERHPGLETGLIVDDERAEPEPSTVTDMRAVPAHVAASEHAVSRIRLKAHVSFTLARKPPLRQYVEDVIGISPEEDWEQLLVKARAGGSDGC